MLSKRVSKLLGNRTPCPNAQCNGANLPNRATCAFCGTDLTADVAPGQPGTPLWGNALEAQQNYAQQWQDKLKDQQTTQKKRLPKRLNEAEQKLLDAPRDNRKRLIAPATQPTHFEAIAYGNPVTQGSMQKNQYGRLEHVKQDELYAWRQLIEDALRKIYAHPDWVPVDTAVIAEAIFTIPRPASYPDDVVLWADSKPDTDKLQRGLGDSLSPNKGHVKQGANTGRTRFRLVNEDGRIVRWVAEKTYPSPLHTHPGALSKPGVRVRVIVLDKNPPRLPPVVDG